MIESFLSPLDRHRVISLKSCSPPAVVDDAVAATDNDGGAATVVLGVVYVPLSIEAVSTGYIFLASFHSVFLR